MVIVNLPGLNAVELFELHDALRLRMGQLKIDIEMAHSVAQRHGLEERLDVLRSVDTAVCEAFEVARR